MASARRDAIMRLLRSCSRYAAPSPHLTTSEAQQRAGGFLRRPSPVSAESDTRGIDVQSPPAWLSTLHGVSPRYQMISEEDSIGSCLSHVPFRSGKKVNPASRSVPKGM
ncbi:uncharacterized protein LOC118645311 [Monomorium pharaonis]|uniref:uncharacterized protein LOC118645311 n=1 Tax=Monomorium pharaonis TaxID=307658 RepID=UPI0017460508|nr:uncharacterized protein LOC118645311 [Monomorium pharaonis]